jgi:hypothetical protein
MAKTTRLLIEFPPTTHTTETGDGVLIHWTGQRTSHSQPFRWVCASVESTRQPQKRMVKYLAEEAR